MEIERRKIMLPFYLSLIEDFEQKSIFEKIYNQHRNQMFLLANNLLHNTSDAEDVVHDVFVKIATRHMEFIQNIENPEDLRNYLLKATKNTALNQLNKKHNRTTSLDTLMEYDFEETAEITDEDFIEFISTKTEYESIVEAMLSLKEPYKDILYYHFVLELSIPEAAQHLNRNETTAKKQLVRGKKMLLNILQGKGENDALKKQ